jgi:hypothetical protein
VGGFTGGLLLKDELLLDLAELPEPELVEQIDAFELSRPDLPELDMLCLERVESVLNHVLAAVPDLLGNH